MDYAVYVAPGQNASSHREHTLDRRIREDFAPLQVALSIRCRSATSTFPLQLHPHRNIPRPYNDQLQHRQQRRAHHRLNIAAVSCLHPHLLSIVLTLIIILSITYRLLLPPVHASPQQFSIRLCENTHRRTTAHASTNGPPAPHTPNETTQPHTADRCTASRLPHSSQPWAPRRRKKSSGSRCCREVLDRATRRRSNRVEFALHVAGDWTSSVARCLARHSTRNSATFAASYWHPLLSAPPTPQPQGDWRFPSAPTSADMLRL